MRGTYPSEMRVRVIGLVEAGTSRREAAEQLEISASSAIRWMQRWEADRTSGPITVGPHANRRIEDAGEPCVVRNNRAKVHFADSDGQFVAKGLIRSDLAHEMFAKGFLDLAALVLRRREIHNFRRQCRQTYR